MTLQISTHCRPLPSLTHRRSPAARRLHTTVQAMVKATWQGAVLATSNDTQQVEGNHYFPPESINKEVGLLDQNQPLSLICPKGSPCCSTSSPAARPPFVDGRGRPHIMTWSQMDRCCICSDELCQSNLLIAEHPFCCADQQGCSMVRWIPGRERARPASVTSWVPALVKIMLLELDHCCCRYYAEPFEKATNIKGEVHSGPAQSQRRQMPC